MNDKSIWRLELVYEGGLKLIYPIEKSDYDWLTEIVEVSGNKQRRIVNFVSKFCNAGGIVNCPTQSLAINTTGLLVMRAYQVKGNPLDDAAHYEDPLN
jgi:hypothetical protein